MLRRYILAPNSKRFLIQSFKQDWKNYTYLSKEYYNSKHNITHASIKRYNQIFQPGVRVLYYIGDKQVARRKWRTKWTGPWTIDYKLNDSTVILVDPTSGNQKRVSMDRLKTFKDRDVTMMKYMDVFNQKKEYKAYREYLKENLHNYNVKIRRGKVNLNYNDNNSTRPY